MEKADIKKNIHLALVALIFYIQKGTDGNHVTLLPDGIADVMSGKPLSLQCVYNGTYNPFTFNFYLNQSTNGLQIRVSNCMIVSAVGYNTSLYNRSCGTNSVSLIILAVSLEHNGQKWECDVSFTTVVPIPPKASTIIRVTAAKGNNVTLLPDGIADVMSGKLISLQCVYNGTNNPFTFNFYLNNDTNGLRIRVSSCRIAIAVGYNTSLYNQSCGTNNVSLIILAVSQEDNGQKWECDVSFITAAPIPPKASTIIRVTAASTTRTTTITVTSSYLFSTSMSSTSTSATTDNTATVLPPNDTNNTSTSISPTITGSAVSATSSTSASTNSAAVSYANNISNVSTSANPTAAEPTAITKTSTDNNGTKSSISDTDIKVIVPAVVVPCGLLIIGAIVLVVLCARRKAGKNVRESPDGKAIQDKGNNIDGWKQSFRHGRATDNLDTVYTTPDGFIIYIGPAAMSTAGSYKDKKHHVVTDQYSIPYPDTYGNQTVYFSSTYKSDRTYAQMGKTYEGHQPASNPMATSRLAYDLTVCYPQTGYYGQIGKKQHAHLGSLLQRHGQKTGNG